MDKRPENNYLIDKKKLTTIMKRFLNSKKSDPEITKWYRVERGVDFMATTLGSAVQLLFHNKYAGRLSKNADKNYYVKPLPKGEQEESDYIPEMETIKDGKKNITRPTGEKLDYPDVSGFFKNLNLNDYQKLEYDIKEIDNFISIHEAMSKASKVGGDYNTAEIEVIQGHLTFTLYDSPLNFECTFKSENEEEVHLDPYTYDFDLMISILKSLKDLSPDKIEMYVKDTESPIVFVGTTVDYHFYFAVHKKLVR